jgi:hypothetical protein
MAKWFGQSIRWFRNHAWEVCGGRVRTGKPILVLRIHAWVELPVAYIQGATGDNSSREDVQSKKGCVRIQTSGMQGIHASEQGAESQGALRAQGGGGRQSGSSNRFPDRIFLNLTVFFVNVTRFFSWAL